MKYRRLLPISGVGPERVALAPPHELLSQATLEQIGLATPFLKEDDMTTTLMYVEAECRLALSEADTAMYSGERPFVRAASIMVDLKPKCEKRRLFKAMWRRTACILLVEMSLLKGMVHRAQALLRVNNKIASFSEGKSKAKGTSMLKKGWGRCRGRCRGKSRSKRGSKDWKSKESTRRREFWSGLSST